MHVLALSYGKNLFTQNSERERMEACANAVDDLHIIIFTRHPEHKEVHEGRLHLYPAGGKTKVGMLISAYRIGRKIIAKKPNAEWVVSTQDPFETSIVGIALSLLTKASFNIQIHGDFFSSTFWRKEHLLNFLRYVWSRCILKRADTVRTVSGRVTKALEDFGVRESRIRQLPVAIPVQKFLLAPESTVARELFPKNAVIVLTVARLVSEKDLALLIEAFAKVALTYKDAYLLIIGKGPERLKLQQKASALCLTDAHNPRVRFLPWTDDAPAYMKSSDVYALSSRYEGYARVIPEAMAAGLPLVTTDVGCVGGVFLNKVHGEVVSVGDTDGFAQALATLVHDTALRAQYAEAGRKTAEQFNDVSTYPEAWVRTLL